MQISLLPWSSPTESLPAFRLINKCASALHRRKPKSGSKHTQRTAHTFSRWTERVRLASRTTHRVLHSSAGFRCSWWSCEQGCSSSSPATGCYITISLPTQRMEALTPRLSLRTESRSMKAGFQVLRKRNTKQQNKKCYKSLLRNRKSVFSGSFGARIHMCSLAISAGWANAFTTAIIPN